MQRKPRVTCNKITLLLYNTGQIPATFLRPLYNSVTILQQQVLNVHCVYRENKVRPPNTPSLLCQGVMYPAPVKCHIWLIKAMCLKPDTLTKTEGTTGWTDLLVMEVSRVTHQYIKTPPYEHIPQCMQHAGSKFTSAHLTLRFGTKLQLVKRFNLK